MATKDGSNDAELNAKHDKQMQAMIFAIENYPQINRTKLMKFIFFVDLFSYTKQGKTILENDYYRLPKGPVPKYGFEITDSSSNNEMFSMSKIPDGKSFDGREIYHYVFTLNPGISSNLTKYFKDCEIDLLNLTLQTIIFNDTSKLSNITHQYKLWTDSKDGYPINLENFRLNEKEEEELEVFLNTKVYLSPIKEKKSNIPNIRQVMVVFSSESPKCRLPIYVNSTTGKIIPN